MKKSIILRATMLLTLLFGAMSAVLAEDRLYIDAVNIEPGETKTFTFNLENSQEFYGFQADISLPEGVEIVMNGNQPDITLSSRMDVSYRVVTNLLSSGSVRLGTFSTSHTPISGQSGALLYIKVKADDSFIGGEIALSDILFIDANDRDVELPDYRIDLGTVHSNKFYIPDFKIDVGETKTVAIVLDNETRFTAFQTDIYLPEGLTIEPNTFVLSSRGSTSHTVTAKSFSDGRTRIACLSTGNDIFTGDSGELLSFDITANKDLAETCQIELKNQIFSMSNAKEIILPNSVTNVTTGIALVETVTLNKNTLALFVGDSEVLSVAVLPSFASTKDVEWSVDEPTIVSVDQSGRVSALKIGTATVKAMAVDGSGKFDECVVSVSGIPVTSITLSQNVASIRETESLILTATTLPATASDKSVTWESLSPEIATVGPDGIVTGIKVGQAIIVATSVSNPEVTAECNVTVTPMPVTSISLNKESITLEVGNDFQIIADVLPETATDKGIIWSIDDDGVASVSPQGLVTAKALGVAHVTATAADGFGAKAFCEVNVVPIHVQATGISITAPEKTEFKVGETIELSATVSPENTTDKSITWNSENPEIASVNNQGVVTALSLGEAKITATNSANISDDITLTVIETLAESVSLIPEKVTLRAGGVVNLVATISPSTTTNKGLTWSSSAPEVADVDGSGNVTAYKVGNTIITVATIDGSEKSAQCNVTVEPTPTTGIQINYEGSKTLFVGNTVSLSATVSPEDATDKSIIWKSQDDAILTVSEEGVVEAKSLGEAWISATASGGQSDFITFKVDPTLISEITLNETTLQLKDTDTYKLIATIKPEDATYQTLSWESSDQTVASVDGQGNVTALKIGSADITARATDGSNTFAKCSIKVIATPVEKVRITAKGSTTLKATQTVQLEAEVLPANATDKSVSWSSSANEIATVSPSGLVTAISVGETTVKATSTSGVSDEIIITVSPTLAERIVIEPHNVETFVGTSGNLTATIYPETTTNKDILWESSAPDIVEVFSDGSYYPHKSGEATIKVTTADGTKLSDECLISVTFVEATGISIDYGNSHYICVGDRISTHANIFPENASDKNVVWTSSNDGVLKIDRIYSYPEENRSDVEFIAVGEGEAIIKAVNSAGQHDEIWFRVVRVKTQDMYFEPDEIIVPLGDTVKLPLILEPEEARNNPIDAYETGESILSVNVMDGGISVTGKKIGHTNVMAESLFGHYAECYIEVVPKKVEIIKIVPEGETTLMVGQKVRLNAEVYPVNATDPSVTWSSSAPNVASVDSYGNVTAISIGETDIEVAANDGSGVKAICYISVVATPVENVRITAKGSTTLKATQTVQLEAEVLPANATDRSVSWSSSANEIATISPSGLVTAVSVGSATITATAGEKSTTIEITVVKTLAQSISLNRSTASLKVAGTIQLTAQFTPSSTTDQRVVWSSDDPLIASVTAEGLVTAHNLGNCRITATAQDGSNATAYCDISVGETAATSVKITPEGPFTLNYGETVQLNATVLPEKTTDKSVSWLSQSAAVEVDQTGLVRAVSAVENNWIKVTNSAGQTDLVYVTVLPLKVSAIELSQNSGQLQIGGELKLTATVKPENATDTSVKWSSTNPSVASVDASGNVWALSIGETDIEVAANDGSGVKAICHISVVPTPVESVSITAKGSTTLKATQTVQLEAEVLPANATDKSVSWSSSANEIATVSPSGLVTAVSVGSATITATAGEKSTTIEITVEKTLAQFISLNRATASMKVSDTVQLSAQFTPSTTTDKRVKWTTSASNIATVSDDGLVTAVGVGNCVITAIAQDGSNATASCDITVEITEAISVKITPEGPFTLNYGETVQLSATVLPETTTDKSVSWQSQSAAVEVDQTGLVRAVSAVENNWIKVTNSAGQTDLVYVTVRPLKVSAIELSQNTGQLQVGGELKLTATVKPENATDTSVKWTSTNPSVASVDAYGNVLALSIGETDIEVAANDGSGVKAICHISVVATPVESVRITAKGSTTLKATQTVQLEAEVLPANATDGSVSWSSSANAVATVSPSGLVTAVGVGNAEITAAAGNKTAKISITVEPTLVSSLTFTIASLSMEVGETKQLNVIVSPSTATNQNLQWSSQNPEIAKVDAQGNVSAIALGETVIDVMAVDGSNVKNSIAVNVKPTPVTEIIIEYSGKTSLKVGETAQLKVKILPENTTDKSYTWKVSDPNILSVTDSGLVTALRIGQSDVFALAKGDYPYSRIQFTVVPTLVEKISIEKERDNIKVGETVQLTAKITPETATQPEVDWLSADNSILTVDEKGLVTAKAIGSALITAKAKDGSQQSASTLITVLPTKAERIDVSALGLTTLKDGEEVQLIATVYPANASYQTITWKSENEKIAMVSENGLVTAGAMLGSTTIKATNSDGVTGSIDITVVETPVESIMIFVPTDPAYTGDIIEFKAEIQPIKATEKTVDWKIENEDILSIKSVSDDNSLKCEALKPGITTVSATSKNGIVASMSFEVRPIRVEQIIFKKKPQTLNVGETAVIEVSILPENADNRILNWTYDQNIILIDDNLAVSALKPGSTEVTAFATDGSNVSSSFLLDVVQPVISIVLNEHQLSLEVPKTFELVASIEPINATNKSVKWESADPAVGEVDENGVISAIGEGETVITVSTLDGSDLSDECALKVTKAQGGVDNIILDDIDITITDSSVIVRNIDNGTLVSLYGLDGILYKSTSSTADSITFDIVRSQYYILRVGNRSLKIAPK